MEVHLIHAKDIYVNLALEQELFASLPQGAGRLLIWKNNPAVVMGRFQNPWLECNLTKMIDSNISLARRQSGGGTVYHDLGNMNISFLDWNEDYDKNRNNLVLIETLKRHGHDPVASGRSDIQIRTRVGNRKVSGAAFKQKKDRSFHHCTMLLRANLDLLNAYLLPKFKHDEAKTKAISSVRSIVANTLIEEEIFISDLIKEYERERKCKVRIIHWSEEEALEKVKGSAYLEKLRSWEWVFGETPLFELELEKNGWNVKIAVKKGIVRELELAHESLHPSFLEELEKKLSALTIRPGCLEDIFLGLDGVNLYKHELEVLRSLLKESFSI